MTEEEWRPIPGFPDYEVSNLGRVLSRKQLPEGLLLHGSLNASGYPVVSLRRNGKLHTWNRHRAVALAFLGVRPDGLETRHLDGDKLNNALSNLAFGTAKENMQDQLSHGHHAMVNKTHCPRGHEYAPHNTYLQPTASGHARVCRTCKRARQSTARANAALRAANVAA